MAGTLHQNRARKVWNILKPRQRVFCGGGSVNFGGKEDPRSSFGVLPNRGARLFFEIYRLECLFSREDSKCETDYSRIGRRVGSNHRIVRVRSESKH